MREMKKSEKMQEYIQMFSPSPMHTQIRPVLLLSFSDQSNVFTYGGAGRP
jgi:hypothetical protein